MKIWSKVIAAGMMALGLLTGTANASTIDEVMNASYKLYRNNEPVCSGTLVNTPKIGKQLFVTSAHCLVDLDTAGLYPSLVKVKEDNFTIKYIVFDEEMRPTIERTYHMELYNDLVSTQLDLALLQFRDHSIKLPAVDIASNEVMNSMKVGDDVAVVGFPLGFDTTVTKGQFSGKLRSDKKPIDTVVYRYTAPSTYGNSGGGLYLINNNDYKLIGVVSHVLDGTIGKGIPMGFMNFAIPAIEINKILNVVDEVERLQNAAQ